MSIRAIGMAGFAALGLLAAAPAGAAMYGFTIGGFSEGASLSFSFEGVDADSDGILYGFFPADCGCGGPASEVTALSLTFTGNSLVSAFSYAATDIAGSLGSLTFGEFDSYQLYYVIDPNGTGAIADGVPLGTMAGDADISLFASIEGGAIGVIGAACNAFASGPYFGDGMTCAVMNREIYDISFEADVATVPEPASLAILGAGVGLLAATRRRRVSLSA